MVRNLPDRLVTAAGRQILPPKCSRSCRERPETKRTANSAMRRGIVSQEPCSRTVHGGRRCRQAAGDLAGLRSAAVRPGCAHARRVDAAADEGEANLARTEDLPTATRKICPPVPHLRSGLVLGGDGGTGEVGDGSGAERFSSGRIRTMSTGAASRTPVRWRDGPLPTAGVESKLLKDDGWSN